MPDAASTAQRLASYVAMTIAVSIAFAIVAFAFAGVRGAFSAMVAATVAVGNLAVIARILGRAFAGGGLTKPVVARTTLFYVAKVFALVAVLFVILRTGWVQPLAFAFGLFCLPVGIAIAEMRRRAVDREGE
jgi:hypothetical protein